MSKNSKTTRRTISPKDLLKHFSKYLKPLILQVVLSLIYVIIFVGALLALPFLTGVMIDNLYPVLHYETIIIYSLISFGLILISAVFDYLFEYTVSTLSFKIVYEIRKDIYAKFNDVPISVIDSYTIGNLIQTIILDCEYVSNGLLSSLKQFYQGIVTIIATLSFMFSINYILALVVVVLTPLSVVVSRTVSKISSKHFKKQSSKNSYISSQSLEYINNIKLVQSLNYQTKSYKDFEKLNGNLSRSIQKAQFSSSWTNPTTRLVNNTIYCIVGIVGVILLVLKPTFVSVVSIGVITSFLSYTLQYTKPFNEISSVVSEIGIAVSSYERIYKFLQRDNDTKEGFEFPFKTIQSIEFKDLTFSYDGKKNVFDKLNLKITRGMKVALVGKTGCGKTTLINVLLRFYEPTSGTILINGEDYKNFSKESLRKYIGMVLQDSWIFDGTVKENINYGNDHASSEDIIKATKLTNTYNFIESLPNKFETKINNKYGLSEGEKQLVAISRCMVSLPELLILDEATSSVDTRTEIKIADAFDKITQNRTSIVIAHRLSTIVNADLICVIDNGHIIESGKHEELLNLNGFYKDIYQSQFKSLD